MHNDFKADILTDHRAMTREQVGGKFHNQALMREQGINVPEFFCLSSALFQRVVRPAQARIAEVLQGLDARDRKAVQQAAQRLHALMHELVIDPATQAAINRALYRHLPNVQLVSVRACMVSQQAEFSEDSASNPFAGISESFLYVRPADVLARVRDCWASAFAEKALLYRLSQGIDPLDVSVVVGVQRMVFGERSFVMFTCDPNTAARDTLLVAGYGIGEGVVQESVPVDHYFVNAKSGAIERVLANKQTMLTFDADAGFGLRESPVYEQYHAPACLNDDEIKALRELGQQIEAVFGWPQDIEGTIDAQGRVHILQARPVSIDFTHKRLWTGLNVTESYPGVSSPLTYTLARLFYRVIFRDIYKRAGASDAQLTDNHHRLDSMIGYVNGRIYYSLNSFYLLHGMVPIFPLLCKAWENMVGLKTSYFIASGETPQPVGTWRHRWNVARAMGTFVTEFVRLPQRMRGYKAWWQGRAKQARHVLKTERDALALSEEFHRLWRDVGQHWGVTLINDAYIFSLFAIVGGLFKRWGLNADPALLSNLLCGDDEIESVEVFMSVLRIAEHIRRNEALACNFLDSDDAVLVARYRARQFDSDLLSLLDHHIARFGDRSMEELKVENPSLREDPTVLLRGIKRFIKSDLNVDACRRAELDKRAQGEQALDARFGKWSPRKALLRWMLKLLREVIAHRENSRYCRSELFGICRDIFYAQAEHLVAKGVIDQPADVCFLTVDEIMGFANGTGVDESFQSTVARRREQLQVYASQDVPETLATNGALRNNVLTRERPTPGAAGSALSGLGSSMGVARGHARVVLDPNAVEDLPPDSILVTRETDPGWLFLMLASAGIVVERGSMLSHTAITGRKFGIPTVVGVDDACSRIPNGAPLEINGGSGVVKLLGEAT